MQPSVPTNPLFFPGPPPPLAGRSATRPNNSNYPRNAATNNVGGRANVHRAAPPATRPCLICLDVPRSFPEPRPTARCTHVATVCVPCLEQHMSHALLTQGLTTVRCPDPECGLVMEYADVLRGSKGNTACLNRYEALLLRSVLSEDRRFIWCKNTACASGQLHEGGADAPIVVCQACGTRSCFVHEVLWHTDLTCDQYDAEIRRQEQANDEYINLHTKRCPGIRCGRPIEKDDGCDHMTCRRPAGCGHEFCWICLADFGPIAREGNHRHRTSCRWHPDHLPTGDPNLVQPNPFIPPPQPTTRPPVNPVRPTPRPRPVPVPRPIQAPRPTPGPLPRPASSPGPAPFARPAPLPRPTPVPQPNHRPDPHEDTPLLESLPRNPFLRLCWILLMVCSLPIVLCFGLIHLLWQAVVAIYNRMNSLGDVWLFLCVVYLVYHYGGTFLQGMWGS